MAAPAAPDESGSPTADGKQPSGIASGSKPLRHFILVVVPLAVILGAVGLATYVYLQQRQAYFIERYVRALAVLAEQTEGAIDGLDSAFDGAITEWKKSAERTEKLLALYAQQPSTQEIASALLANGNPSQTIARELGAMCCPRDVAPDPLDGGVCLPPPARVKPAVCDLNDSLRRQLELVPLGISAALPPNARDAPTGKAPGVLARANLVANQQTRLSPRRIPTTVEQPPTDTADATLYFCRETPIEVRLSAAAASCGWPSRSDWLCAEKPLREMLDPFVNGSALDHLDLFLVDERGTTLYERGISGLRLAALKEKAESAAAAKDGAPRPPEGLPSLEEVVRTTGVRPIEVGGIPYMLFSQPLRLKARNNAQYTTWAVGALIPVAALQSDARRMPVALLAGVPAVFLLALLALPILKMLTIGSRERLAGATVNGAALAILGMAALATLGVLIWYAQGVVRRHVDTELRLFARRLQSNLRAELVDARGMLQAFADRRLRELGGKVPEGDWYMTCDRVLDGAEGSCRSTSADAPAPQDYISVLERYPVFDMLILTDGIGMQREKWTVENTNTPAINMSGTPSFRDVMQGRMLQPPSAELQRDWRTARYALHVSTSRNTGKLITLLSVPLVDELSEPGGTSAEEVRAARSGRRNWFRPIGVATMTLQLLSVEDPITPPGVGFAIIESSGRVVFHSNNRRRLYENFFAEASGDLELRSAVFADRAGAFDIEYHGAPERAFTTPLRDTPWSLVVFRERESLRTATIEAAATAVLCLLVVIVLYAAWLGLARVLVGSRLPACLWPDPRATARYWTLVMALLVLSGWFVWTAGTRDAIATLLITVTTPLIALTLVILTLGVGQTSIHRWLIGVAALGALVAIALFVSLTLHGPIGALPWVVIGFLFAAAVVSWEPSWLPLGAPAATLAPYVSLIAVLLVDVAVLPTATLFRDAYELSAEAVGRSRQLALNERIASQRQAVWQRLRNVGNGRLLMDFRRERRWDESGLVAYRQAAARSAAPVHPGSASDAERNRDAPPVNEFPVASSLAGAVRSQYRDFCRDERVRDLPCTVGPRPRQVSGNLRAQQCGLYKRHFSGVVMSALPVLNQDALELRHAVFRHASDCVWWTGAGDHLMARSRFADNRRNREQESVPRDAFGRPLCGGQRTKECCLPVDHSIEMLRTEFRQSRTMLRHWGVRLDWPGGTLARVIYALVAAAAAVGVWWGLRVLVRRMFCLDGWEQAGADTVGLAAAVGDFHVRPSAATVERLTQRAEKLKGLTIKLKTLSAPAELADRIANHPDGPLVLTHFERALADDAWSAQAVAALEDLVLRRRRRVDIVSDIDLFALLAQRQPATAGGGTPTAHIPAAHLRRWVAVLAWLDKRCADLPPAPVPPRPGEEETLRDECQGTPRLRSIGAAIRADARWTGLSRSALGRYVGDLAEAHYRDIWLSLDDEERLVIYHLGRDGFVNAKNRDLAGRLMRRGLIRRAPALRLMNESFRQFAREVEDAATIRSWERAAGASAWNWLRNGVMGIAVVGGVFLFVTQPDAYAKWVGLFAALTTVGGGMSQLLGLFGGSRRAESAS